MRKLLASFVFICALLLNSFTLGGGDCSGYYPVKEGTTFEISSYSAKGVLTGTSKCTIGKDSTAADTLILLISGAWSDAKGKEMRTTDFNVKCVNGVIFLNIGNMGLDDPKQTYSQNAKVIMQGSYLNIPNNPTPGQKLLNGTLTTMLISKNRRQSQPWTITSTISNRRVEKMEKITTPAGTFNCIKITYDVSTFTIFSVKSHVAEWYALGSGMVRSERYSEAGELQSYSVLTSISGN